MFDTKIAIVVREDLAICQKHNVTAFLTSGMEVSADIREEALARNSRHQPWSWRICNALYRSSGLIRRLTKLLWSEHAWNANRHDYLPAVNL
jgi:hypothetical protein